MPYIYGENNQYASVRSDRQAAFKSSTVWYVRAGKGLMCITYPSKVVQFAHLQTSSSSQWMIDYFYKTSVMLSPDLIWSISQDTHTQSQCAMSIWKAPMSVWFGKFCFQNLDHLDSTICRVTFYIWLAKMFLKGWAHNQRNHELGCSLAEVFEGRPKMFRAGLISLLCDADNFSKTGFAWGQHKIQHREWKIKNIPTNKYMHNFTCVFFYTSYAIQINWQQQEKCIKNVIHNVG